MKDCANETEDEIHFLVSCNMYNEQRQYLFDSLKSNASCDLNTLSSVDKFIFLMTLDEQRHLHELAKFVYLSFIKRSQYVSEQNSNISE